MGFGEADILEAGPTVLVSYDQHSPLATAHARAIAESQADTIWADRDSVSNDVLTPSCSVPADCW